MVILTDTARVGTTIHGLSQWDGILLLTVSLIRLTVGIHGTHGIPGAHSIHGTTGVPASTTGILHGVMAQACTFRGVWAWA